ncbi:MAG: ATP cone domain-containing protein [Candidatus Paceibacterota bacterium]
MNHLITITKSDGTKQLFEEEKLVNSLRRIGSSAEAIEDVVDQVEKEMKEGMSTTDIYNRAFFLLRKHSTHAAAKYSIRRAMMELGPDGFPFEKFIARLFETWGYKTLTDQIMLGRCVDHEIDVLAWKGEELAMVEAKYHNEYGMKSDLKVVLYVKARYDDLMDTVFENDGLKRKLSGRYLVTNTKFTDKAVRYAECNGLKLIGWNYPAKGNLHDLIFENSLQPIACITSLTREQKKDLVGRGLLLCTDIIGKPSVLHDIGVKPEETEKILTEAQMVIEEGK